MIQIFWDLGSLMTIHSPGMEDRLQSLDLEVRGDQVFGNLGDGKEPLPVPCSIDLYGEVYPD